MVEPISRKQSFTRVELLRSSILANLLFEFTEFIVLGRSL